MDDAHEKRIEALRGLGKKADELATGLNESTCTRNPGTSCIRLEESRPLTKSERESNWTMRPYRAYDPARMCPGCAACWYANMARVSIDDEIRVAQLIEREEREAKRSAVLP